MLWLYLHFPQLPLDHINRGVTSAVPVAIIDNTPPSILWSSDTAIKQGIKAGMSLTTAYCLIPELQVAHHHPHRVNEILKELAATAYQYSAHVSLYPPDGLLLEVGSMLALFGGLNELWNKIYAEISNQGFTLWLATGPTPLSARLLARNHKGQCHTDPQKLLLPIESLNLYQAELPDKAAERCYRMGIKTVKQLCTIPETELSERFGPDLNTYMRKIVGKENDPQVAYKAPDIFIRRLDFIEEISHISGVLFPLQRVLQALSEYLTHNQLSTDTLTLTLKHRHHSDTSIQVRGAQPEHHSDGFMQLCHLRLERHTTPEAIIALILKVDKLTPLDISSADFFDQKGQNQNSFLHLIGKLHARLGDQSIKKITVHPDHRPENTQHFLSATTPSKATRTPKNNSPYSERRPLWLMPEPPQITPDTLTFLIGPERISSGWWDDNRVLRDYYIARFPHGAIGWVYRVPSGEWFLQGWFA